MDETAEVWIDDLIEMNFYSQLNLVSSSFDWMFRRLTDFPFLIGQETVKNKKKPADNSILSNYLTSSSRNARPFNNVTSKKRDFN